MSAPLDGREGGAGGAASSRAALRDFWIGAALSLILAYPTFFHAQRFHNPWTSVDILAYHDMVQRPLALADVPAPFGLRPLSPLIARGFVDLGLATDHWIRKDPAVRRSDRVDPRVAFALILTNLTGLCLSGGLVFMAARRRAADPARGAIIGVVAIGGFLLAGSTVYFALEPLIEGMTMAMTTAVILLARRRDAWFWACLPLLAVAVLQKEVVPMAVAPVALTEAALLTARARRDGWDARSRHRARALVILAGAAVALLALHLGVRRSLGVAADPFLFQLDPSLWSKLLQRAATMPGDVLFAASRLNLEAVWVALLAFRLWRGPRPRRMAEAMSLVVACCALWVCAIATATAGPDRVVMVLSPLIALSLAELAMAGPDAASRGASRAA